MKSNAPSELKRKNLLVNEDKSEDYCIQRNGDQSWKKKKCRFLGSLLGNKEDNILRKRHSLIDGHLVWVCDICNDIDFAVLVVLYWDQPLIVAPAIRWRADQIVWAPVISDSQLLRFIDRLNDVTKMSLR